MQQASDSVYIIANYWEWRKFNILSLLIRIVCFGFNHVARRRGDYVYEMKGAKFTWMLRRLMGKPVSYAANGGSGLTVTPLAQWLNHANRRVIELEPLKPLKPREHRAGYGFLDLVQQFLHIARKRWFMVGHSWNGVSGCRYWEGETCAEMVGIDFDVPDAHILAPISFLMLPEYFRKVREFETRKR